MKTSVVILNFNGRNFLEKFLPSVVLFLGNAQIVVADNGSTDDSVPFLRKNYPEIHLILLEKNYGFAEGYNLALKNLDAQYYVLLNSDVEVTENWLSTLENFMDKHPDVVACQPKIRSYLNPEKFEYAGACGGLIDGYGYPFCRGRILNKVEADNGQYNDVAEIFWASGACLFIRADEYWQAGGLDGRFFAHQEEIDLCWRLKARGKSIVCIPKSVVFHVGGGALNYENPRKTFLNFRNNFLLLYKNLPAKKLFKVFIIRFLLDYAAFLQMIFQRKFKNAIEIPKARIAFYKMRKNFTQDRAKNLALTVNFFPKGMIKGLIFFKKMKIL
ncbi:MAG: glycosyltransferase family 2 protein [Prevotellaceae bacterium]|jgi:GT2 family glycosyltransferase|nr:glycosyltransferase family 2 protein [Prevotellaceae bacterium]